MSAKDRSVKPGFAVLLAGYLNERMLELGVNQTWLRERARMDQSALSRTLNASRNITADELDRVARALGTDPTAVVDVVRSRAATLKNPAILVDVVEVDEITPEG